ncbi:nuclease-related domain-containing protein [Actinocorallia longicatena]|uniref:NERD domain-containing protein n=1 Tax=Actinocorallia longicatena TaxID=111803 RepID=A0ABP6QI24_9ACTN
MIGDSIYRESNPALVGGSPQQVHEMLWSAERDKRMRFRAIVAGLLVIIGWKFVSPWAGVGAAAAYLVVDLAMAVARRLSSSVWRQGLSGERRTARALALLERRGYRVLHRRVVPGHGTVAHIVIGPSRVWLVENEVYDPETDLVAIKGKLFVGKDVKTHVNAKLERAATDVSEMLSGALSEPVKAAVIVAVHGGRPKMTRMTAGGVVLMRPWRVPGFVRRTSGPGMDPNEITRTALYLFGPAGS